MTEFDKLKKSLLKQGELFEDNDFQPTQTAVFYHQTPPFQFVWKRPREICNEPIFLSETATNCFDVNPGKLGKSHIYLGFSRCNKYSNAILKQILLFTKPMLKGYF